MSPSAIVTVGSAAPTGAMFTAVSWNETSRVEPIPSLPVTVTK